MTEEKLNTLSKELVKLIEVVEEIEKRTVEKPSDNYIVTPIKMKLMDIKDTVKRLVK